MENRSAKKTGQLTGCWNVFDLSGDECLMRDLEPLSSKFSLQCTIVLVWLLRFSRVCAFIQIKLAVRVNQLQCPPIASFYHEGKT